MPPGAATVGWQLAMILRTESDGAAIGLKGGETGRIPFAQMQWARPLRDDSTLGAFPRNAADVVKPGDLVLVEPLADDAAKPAGAKSPTAATLYNLCQIPEVSGALVAIDPHTGRVHGDERRFQLRTQPVQPRDPGQAPAGLVDQAVCLPDRAGTRLHPVDPGR